MRKPKWQLPTEQLDLFEWRPVVAKKTYVPVDIDSIKDKYLRSFFYHQNHYMAGEKGHLVQMYDFFYLSCLKIIKKERHKKHFFIDPTVMQEKAETAATYILEQYLQRDDFFLCKPFGYMYLRCEAVLYQKGTEVEIVYTDKL